MAGTVEMQLHKMGMRGIWISELQEQLCRRMVVQTTSWLNIVGKHIVHLGIHLKGDDTFEESH